MMLHTVLSLAGAVTMGMAAADTTNTQQLTAPTDASQYSVTWDALLPEPGTNQGGGPTYLNSMPIGNGEFAANVLLDQTTGKVTCLISASSAWSEAGELMKVALLELTLSKELLDNGTTASTVSTGAGVAQTLNPQTATFTLMVGAVTAVTVFIDANSNTLVASSPAAFAGAALTTLRTHATTDTPAFDCRRSVCFASCFGWLLSLLRHRVAAVCVFGSDVPLAPLAMVARVC